MSNSHSVIEALGIGVTLGGKRIVGDITLRINKGDVLCIIGPSGAGKSTAIRALNLLCRIDSGTLQMFGRPVIAATSETAAGPSRSWLALAGLLHRREPGRLFIRPELHRRRVGMVFQEFNLWDNRTVLANVTLGPRQAARVPRQQANDEARALLRQFGVGHLESRRADQLSGGERQRVALVRALAMRPEVLLLDEVTSALDPENVAAMHEALSDLAHAGLTMVIVTHHLEFARRIATEVIMMDGGRIVETGPPQRILGSPTHERTRQFIARLELSR